VSSFYTKFNMDMGSYILRIELPVAHLTLFVRLNFPLALVKVDSFDYYFLFVHNLHLWSAIYISLPIIYLCILFKVVAQQAPKVEAPKLRRERKFGCGGDRRV